jgi:hypothetical protein
MKDCRFFHAHNRDLPIIVTTVLGCMIGLLMSTNSSQSEMQCNALCGVAGGALTGIGFSLLERLYSRFANRESYKEISDFSDEYENEKTLSL